jgi:ABC-type Zn uptake system ZnuABC Zn-binding protein ZnuA
MKSEGVKMVLIEGFRPRRTAERVASEAGAKLVVLPMSVGGVPQAKDYFSLLDYDVSQIVGALKR